MSVDEILQIVGQIEKKIPVFGFYGLFGYSRHLRYKLFHVGHFNLPGYFGFGFRSFTAAPASSIMSIALSGSFLSVMYLSESSMHAFIALWEYFDVVVAFVISLKSEKDFFAVFNRRLGYVYSLKSS